MKVFFPSEPSETVFTMINNILIGPSGNVNYRVKPQTQSGAIINYGAMLVATAHVVRQLYAHCCQFRTGGICPKRGQVQCSTAKDCIANLQDKKEENKETCMFILGVLL